MKPSPISGHVHSIQTLGTLDGPGVRFVIFAQGCPLRCGCCHNPDTWEVGKGNLLSARELVHRAMRYREYFRHDGGITLSGGEPLLQAEFATALFEECHKVRINTCLDTSGCILNDEVKELLVHTDRVLLDIKYPTDALYREHVGCSIEAPLRFLQYLNRQEIPTTLRQVIIPGLTDTDESVDFLSLLAEERKCVDSIELLPFHKLCITKYDRLGIPFPMADMDEPTKERMEYLQARLRVPKKHSVISKNQFSLS